MGILNYDNKEVVQQIKNGFEVVRDFFDGKKKDVLIGDLEV